MEKDSFVFYKSFFEAIKDLKNKEQHQLFMAICYLALEEKEIELTGLAGTIFKTIKPQILANTKKYKDGQKRRKT